MQQQSVEINSVKWVLKELQPMLKDVQRSLTIRCFSWDMITILVIQVQAMNHGSWTQQISQV